PAPAKHGLGPMVGSMKLSHLTEVSSTPHGPLPPLCFSPLGPSPEITLTVKCPAQLVPFMFQNCRGAVLVVPGRDSSCSSGAFSSFDSRLPLASDEYPPVQSYTPGSRKAQLAEPPVRWKLAYSPGVISVHVPRLYLLYTWNPS